MTTLRVYSNRHIKDQVKNIKKNDWIYLENGMSRKRWSRYFSVNNINEDVLNITYITQEEYFTLDNINKFDCIVGNPPYQDGDTLAGGQSKIYNMFSKKALELVKDDGLISFITPQTVCRKNKRFSIIGQQGLKSVDFTTNDDFNVGVNICSWIIDKKYTGNVNVICHSIQEVVPSGEEIYNYEKIDRDFALIFSCLSKVTDVPEKRMFYNNNFGTSLSKVKCELFQYPLHKKIDNNLDVMAYSKRIPHLYKKKKLMISITQSLRDEVVFVDTNDYSHNYVFVEVENNAQVENIKSFIFSKYFAEHSKKWKEIKGSGFNYALTSLPHFDINKNWTNSEVKEFIESYAK